MRGRLPTVPAAAVGVWQWRRRRRRRRRRRSRQRRFMIPTRGPSCCARRSATRVCRAPRPTTPSCCVCAALLQRQVCDGDGQREEGCVCLEGRRRTGRPVNLSETTQIQMGLFFSWLHQLHRHRTFAPPRACGPSARAAKRIPVVGMRSTCPRAPSKIAYGYPANRASSHPVRGPATRRLRGQQSCHRKTPAVLVVSCRGIWRDTMTRRA